MGKTVPYDWQAIEVEYRAGVKTLQQISNDYNMPLSTLHGAAKKKGWVRDLTARAQAKSRKAVDAALADQFYRRKVQDAYDAEVEELAAPVVRGMAIAQTQVRLKYVALADKALALADGYFAELAAQNMSHEELDRVAELVALCRTQDGVYENLDQKEVTRKIEAFEKSLKLDARADTFKKLTDALKTAMALSMQAYGMTDNLNGDAPQDGPELSDNDVARRVAFLLLKSSTNDKQETH